MFLSLRSTANAPLQNGHGAEARSDDAQRNHRQGDDDQKQRAAVVDPPVGQQDRQGVEDHHPGAVQRALQPARQENLFAADRHGVHQRQIAAKVKF